jgi:hypothetical protein
MTHVKFYFPDELERRSVRRVMLSVDGTITKITNEQGEVIYENGSYESKKSQLYPKKYPNNT